MCSTLVNGFTSVTPSLNRATPPITGGYQLWASLYPQGTSLMKEYRSYKALHSGKIKLRLFLTTLYFAGELGRFT